MARVTSTRSTPSTTWALVSTSPWRSITTPDPWPRSRDREEGSPNSSRSRGSLKAGSRPPGGTLRSVSIRTTEAATRWTASATKLRGLASGGWAASVAAGTAARGAAPALGGAPESAKGPGSRAQAAAPTGQASTSNATRTLSRPASALGRIRRLKGGTAGRKKKLQAIEGLERVAGPPPTNHIATRSEGARQS